LLGEAAAPAAALQRHVQLRHTAPHARCGGLRSPSRAAVAAAAARRQRQHHQQQQHTRQGQVFRCQQKAVPPTQQRLPQLPCALGTIVDNC
jgi:hypothetical protein